MGPYDLGSVVPPGDLLFTLTDGNGNPVAASVTPVLTITLPDATTVPLAVASAGTGQYLPASPYVTTEAGHHLWAWAAAGTYPGAYADSFEVRPSPDPTITSLSEERAILKIPAGDTTFDTEIRSFSQALTEWIEYVCGPVVTQQKTEVVRAQGMTLILSHPPVRTDMGTAFSDPNRRDGSTTNGLVSLTPLLTYGFMYDLSQLLVDSRRGIVRQYAGLPFFYSGDPYSQFQAIYWAGRKIIPDGIYQAHKIALKHLWAVERGGLASAASMGESETVQTGFGFSVPNRAAELLTPHSGSAARAAIA